MGRPLLVAGIAAADGLHNAPCRGVVWGRKHRAIVATSTPGAAHGFSECGLHSSLNVAGITVLLHWSWFLVALLEIQLQQDKYGSLT